MHLCCSDTASPDGQGSLWPSAYLTWYLVSGVGEVIDRCLVMMILLDPLGAFKLCGP